MIRINDPWIADFASCNDLGFDLDEESIESIEPALREWLTSANTEEQVRDHLLKGFSKVREYFEQIGAPLGVTHG